MMSGLINDDRSTCGIGLKRGVSAPAARLARGSRLLGAKLVLVGALGASVHAFTQAKAAVPTSSPDPVLSASRSLDGKVVLKFTGDLGPQVLLSASGDFQGWVPITNILAGGDATGFVETEADSHAHRWFRYGPGNSLGFGLLPRMVVLPPGSFETASPESEGPVTKIVVTRHFGIGRYEVTQREFFDLMGINSSRFQDDLERPVEQVSWYAAVEYCRRLTLRERGENRLPLGYEYRLPTSAEWEYACRAGTTTPTAFGPTLSSYQANFNGSEPLATNSQNRLALQGPNLGRTTKVGSYAPSRWDLHDMHGNVWEWCFDGYSRYPGGVLEDPIFPRGNPFTEGIIRGGSWGQSGWNCVSSHRERAAPTSGYPTVGFRVVLARQW